MKRPISTAAFVDPRRARVSRVIDWANYGSGTDASIFTHERNFDKRDRGEVCCTHKTIRPDGTHQEKRRPLLRGRQV